MHILQTQSRTTHIHLCSCFIMSGSNYFFTSRHKLYFVHTYIYIYSTPWIGQSGSTGAASGRFNQQVPRCYSPVYSSCFQRPDRAGDAYLCGRHGKLCDSINEQYIMDKHVGVRHINYQRRRQHTWQDGSGRWSSIKKPAWVMALTALMFVYRPQPETHMSTSTGTTSTQSMFKCCLCHIHTSLHKTSFTDACWAAEGKV